MPLKEPRLRDARYLVWGRKLPCLACRQETLEVDMDHVNLPMQGTKGKKAADNQAVPLCHRCHILRHNTPVGEFYEENTGHTVREVVILARKIYEAYKAGKSHDAVRWIILGW